MTATYRQAAARCLVQCEDRVTARYYAGLVESVRRGPVPLCWWSGQRGVKR